MMAKRHRDGSIMRMLEVSVVVGLVCRASHSQETP